MRSSSVPLVSARIEKGGSCIIFILARRSGKFTWVSQRGFSQALTSMNSLRTCLTLFHACVCNTWYFKNKPKLIVRCVWQVQPFRFFVMRRWSGGAYGLGFKLLWSVLSHQMVQPHSPCSYADQQVKLVNLGPYSSCPAPEPSPWPRTLSACRSESWRDTSFFRRCPPRSAADDAGRFQRTLSRCLL